MGHGVCARAAQGEVQHHNLISSNESGDTHDKDQVPTGEMRRDLLEESQQKERERKRKAAELCRGQQTTHSDSLADERDRERCLRDFLSNKKEENSLSQQDRDGHSQLLSPSCEGDNRDLGDSRAHQIKLKQTKKTHQM